METIRNYVKYPRTYHFPWSNPSTDDKVMVSLAYLESEPEVVATVKLDGEQSTWYRNHIHARSLEVVTGEDHAWVKTLWAGVAHEIPEGWRLCGENLFATHSIHYTNLESYFYLYSIWNEQNECLSWDETREWAQLLNLTTVPELYRGPWNESSIRGLYQPEFQGCPMEGYVVRPTRGFPYRDFRHLVGKMVRPDHVTTSEHWRHQRLVPNELRQTPLRR